MIEMLPVLSVFMLAFSTILLDLAFGRAAPASDDMSHLTDPNAHLEDLVTYAVVAQPRLAKA